VRSAASTVGVDKLRAIIVVYFANGNLAPISRESGNYAANALLLRDGTAFPKPRAQVRFLSGASPKVRPLGGHDDFVDFSSFG